MPRHEFHPRADAGEPHHGKIVMKRGPGGRLQIVPPAIDPHGREPEEQQSPEPPAGEDRTTPPSP